MSAYEAVELGSATFHSLISTRSEPHWRTEDRQDSSLPTR